MAEAVVGADDADRAQLRLRVLVADPEEDRAPVERGAQHRQHVGAALQRGHQLVGPRQVGDVGFREQARGAVHVEVGAGFLLELGEGGAEGGDELRLDPAQLRVGEPGGGHPGADAEPGERLVEVAGGPLDQAAVDGPVELEDAAGDVAGRGDRDHDDLVGLQLQDLDPVDRGAGQRRRGRHRDQVGDLRQRRRRLPHRLVDLAPQPRELELDRGRRHRRLHQRFDVEAVAGIGRHPAGRGVGMGQVAGRLQRRQLGPHRRGAPLDLRPLGDLFRTDRTCRRQVGVDHQLQDQLLAFTQQATDSRRAGTRPRRCG